MDWKELGAGIFSSLESRFKDYLDQNKEVAEFLVIIGRRYATLSEQYHLASDEATMTSALADLRRVENTLELEMDAIEEAAKSAVFEALKSAAGAVLSFAIQNLPTIVAALRR